MIASARFTKITYNAKTERVSVKYQVENGSDEPDEYSVTVRQPPHPDFLEALSALAQHVLDLCELSDIAVDTIEVRGVSFSWAKDVMGATITALRQLKRSQSPLVLNTPHKPADFYGEEGDASQLLPGTTVIALQELIAEAAAFVDGKRGEAEEEDPQSSLFDEPASSGELALMH